MNQTESTAPENARLSEHEANSMKLNKPQGVSVYAAIPFILENPMSIRIRFSARNIRYDPYNQTLTYLPLYPTAQRLQFVPRAPRGVASRESPANRLRGGSSASAVRTSEKVKAIEGNRPRSGSGKDSVGSMGSACCSAEVHDPGLYPTNSSH